MPFGDGPDTPDVLGQKLQKIAVDAKSAPIAELDGKLKVAKSAKVPRAQLRAKSDQNKQLQSELDRIKESPPSPPDLTNPLKVGVLGLRPPGEFTVEKVIGPKDVIVRITSWKSVANGAGGRMNVERQEGVQFVLLRGPSTADCSDGAAMELPAVIAATGKYSHGSTKLVLIEPVSESGRSGEP